MVMLLLFSTLTACFHSSQSCDVINAAERGVCTENSGEANSKALQAVIDEASLTGKTVYIPEGEYEFAENGSQTIGSHCIKMRSGVSVVGDGEKTVLKPVGHTRYGLDMFYFNDYLDTGAAIYLENCRFENFVIDASGSSSEIYTSAGKGFMFNLFKNCHFKKVTVKNTDATGFGVDCPINCTITACTAIGCGKAATAESNGASGFGIGFGYSEEETITVSDCKAIGNTKFGFFFEHQGRFDIEKYCALPEFDFTVKNCFASENLFGFGGINAFNTFYKNCISEKSYRYGFYFENSFESGAIRCKSSGEEKACFAVAQSISADGMPDEFSGIYFSQCEGSYSHAGILTLGEYAKPVTEGCTFREMNEKQRT